MAIKGGWYWAADVVKCVEVEEGWMLGGGCWVKGRKGQRVILIDEAMVPFVFLDPVNKNRFVSCYTALYNRNFFLSFFISLAAHYPSSSSKSS